jgi:ribosomal protein S12 methylthiotransferase
MPSKTYYLLSLGCAKNLVDSESMAELLGIDGFHAVSKPAHAEVIIVNTCGFIKAARQESISELQKLAKKKRSGQLLIAAGCMSERYRQEIVSRITGIDGFVGTRQWMNIIKVIHNLRGSENLHPPYHLPSPGTITHEEPGVLRAAIQGASAYLKIADGCRRSCAYCSIPLIKGTTVSHPIEKVLQDAKLLSERGIKEINIIAQDTTDYGYDLGMKDGLVQLLKRLPNEIPNVPWIRLLYAYPGYISNRLIELIATRTQMLHYLDIPLQHAHPKILKAMKRPASTEWVKCTIDKMRAFMPDLAIRTTFIIGYPGETEEHFKFLLDFMKEVHFDHVGVFPFSFEQGTASEMLGDPIPQELKSERIERLMLLQQEISLTRNQTWIGKTLPVLVEGVDEKKTTSIGRSFRDAPEIDGMVFVNGVLDIGSIVPVRITGAMTHDLIADIPPSEK